MRGRGACWGAGSIGTSRAPPPPCLPACQGDPPGRWRRRCGCWWFCWRGQTRGNPANRVCRADGGDEPPPPRVRRRPDAQAAKAPPRAQAASGAEDCADHQREGASLAGVEHCGGSGWARRRTRRESRRLAGGLCCAPVASMHAPPCPCPGDRRRARQRWLGQSRLPAQLPMGPWQRRLFQGGARQL